MVLSVVLSIQLNSFVINKYREIYLSITCIVFSGIKQTANITTRIRNSMSVVQAAVGHIGDSPLQPLF